MEDGSADISANPAASESSSRHNGNGAKAAPARGRVRRGPAAAARKEAADKGRRKTGPKKRAGGAIASPREQTEAGPRSAEMATQYRKLEEMENIAATKKPSAGKDTAAPTKKPAESVRELVAPHEWESMLNAFDESGVTVTSEYKSAPGEIEIDAEDLWERLSSTRWLKEQNTKDSGEDDPSNKTTVANR